MSREAKIGMLTGLLVIVLIGVLLSEYLGNNGATTPPTASSAMASVGEDFRQRQQDPVLPPGMVRDPVNNALLTPGAGLPGGEVPPAVATDGGTSAGTPVMNPPVVAVADGVVRPEADGNKVELAGPSPNGVQQMVYVTPDDAQKYGPAKVAVTTTTKPAEVIKGETYVIAAKDTLTVIAKKFYKSATKADIARILAANKSVLKDEKSGLVVGKKLLIPYLPGKEPVEIKPVVIAKGVEGKGEALVVPLPKPTDAKGVDVKVVDGKTPEKVEAPKDAKAAPKVYVVAEKDTLVKIARKLSGDKYLTTMKAIKKENGLTDESVLKIGQKLKVPV